MLRAGVGLAAVAGTLVRSRRARVRHGAFFLHRTRVGSRVRPHGVCLKVNLIGFDGGFDCVTGSSGACVAWAGLVWGACAQGSDVAQRSRRYEAQCALCLCARASARACAWARVLPVTDARS